jgi:hypothetical protein
MADNRHSPLELLRQAQRAGARRLVIEGMAWLVYELPASDYDRRARPSLVFESDGSMRRVRTFPENWRDLSDTELAALSWER